MMLFKKNSYNLISTLSLKEKNDVVSIIYDIVFNPVYLSRVYYLHHLDESVVEHSLKVAYKALLYGIKYNLDYESMLIGALLHDFYPNPWYSGSKKSLFKKHGFTHAGEAYDNSLKYYPQFMNDKVKDIILKHMFPLNIKPFEYTESLIVSMIDKSVSVGSFLKNPFQFGKQDASYLEGFKKIVNKEEIIIKSGLLEILCY